jgi:hypothetical protein
VDKVAEKETRNDFQLGWENNYAIKLDSLQQMSIARLQWLSTTFTGYGNGSGDPSVNSGSMANLNQGGTNEEKAWNFFVEKGFTAAAAAGVMGNLKQESGIIPTKKQNNGGPGRGICQWETGGRWDTLVNWANEEGRDQWSIDTQLDFMWKELTTEGDYSKHLLDKNYGGMSALRSMTNYENAVVAFEDSFERAGKPNYPNRYEYAKEYLDKFGKGSGSIAAGLVGTTNMASTGLPGGLTSASISNGKVFTITGSRGSYNSTISQARRISSSSQYKTLDENKYYKNLSGCTMMVAREFYPFVELIHENMRAKGLLNSGRLPVNSVLRIKDPSGYGYDNGAHGWGGAIDIGTYGVTDALSKADICWALGFRSVAIGGSLDDGLGFVHVDISPGASWNYEDYPDYKGPNSWSSYR